MATYPLEGVRVLDMCPLFAGNFANSLLADLGAEVIKVESIQYWQYGCRGATARPTKQDIMRGGGGWGYWQNEPGDRPWDRNGGFNTLSRGKLSFTVDLRRPEGVDVFKRLVKVSDIIVESNAATLLPRLGIDYPVLREVKPDIIVVRMPGFGLSGPRWSYPASAQTMESASGHTLLKGYPDVDPVAGGATSITSDGAAGLGASVAAMMALHYRRRTGKGQLVEFAQAEHFMPLLGQFYMDYILNRRMPTVMSNRHPSAAPCGCYPCAGSDQWVDITVYNDEQWHGFRRALGDAGWTGDPELATVTGRYRKQDEMDKQIAEWTRTRDRYEVMRIMQGQGVPCGPVLSSKDTFSDQHLKAKGHFQEMSPPAAGTYPEPGIPWRMSRTPLRVQRPAPMLGQHNEYIYKEVLGISDEEYARLEAEGHIGDKPAAHL